MVIIAYTFVAMSSKRPTFSRRHMFIAVVVLGTSLAVTAHINEMRRDLERRNLCSGKLGLIVIGMMAYHRDYGRLPPAVVVDRKGHPMHSWRALLLPYVEETALHSRYNFDEPWDGPTNSLLATERPEVYGCPADTSGRSSGEANYVLLTGRRSFFDESGAAAAAVDNPPPISVLLVETCRSGINWLEPRDFNLDDIDLSVGRPTGKNVSSLHFGGAFVATGNVQTSFFPSSMSPQDVKTLLDYNGQNKEELVMRLLSRH